MSFALVVSFLPVVQRMGVSMMRVNGILVLVLFLSVSFSDFICLSVLACLSVCLSSPLSFSFLIPWPSLSHFYLFFFLALCLSLSLSLSSSLFSLILFCHNINLSCYLFLHSGFLTTISRAIALMFTIGNLFTM